jgi:hypothetical protein
VVNGGPLIEVAQQAGPPSRLDLIEHHVSDLDGAVRLFLDVLDGHLEAVGAGPAELTWPGGKRIKLVREDGLPLGGALHHIRFIRAADAFRRPAGQALRPDRGTGRLTCAGQADRA